jgi:hypothetical protein
VEYWPTSKRLKGGEHAGLDARLGELAPGALEQLVECGGAEPRQLGTIARGGAPGAVVIAVHGEAHALLGQPS